MLTLKGTVAIVKSACYFCARSSRMSRTIGALYRFLYAGFLVASARTSPPSGSAERASAASTGSAPLVSGGRSEAGITLGGVALPNPVHPRRDVLRPAILSRAMGLGFGAVTAKSITVGPRPGHPQPNLVRTRSDAGPGPGELQRLSEPGPRGLRASLASLRHRVPLIVSVAGESIADYVKLVRELGPLGELVEFQHLLAEHQAGVRVEPEAGELATLLREVREATAKPLIVKLSPDFADVNEREIIPAALAAGIRIVNYGNTRRIEDRRLSQGVGGLSGPDLFPATLDNVRRTRRTFGADLEIIRTGGVDAPENAWQAAPRGGERGRLLHWIHQPRGPILARQILERLLAAR